MLLRVLILIILLMHSTQADEIKKLRFAIVPKATHSDFFDEVKAGCKDAAKEFENVECIYIGAHDANPITQIEIIKDLIKQKVDGIAVSVIDSKFLIKENILELAKTANIPFITYDSDLAMMKDVDKLRLAYIGTDNFALGVALGDALKELKPKGGTLCIQSGWKNSLNLQERINGIRYSLSGNKSITKLDDISGWRESERCPIYCRDLPDIAIFQLTRAIYDVDAFISVGGWAQYSQHYDEQINPFLGMLHTKQKILIVADTTKVQLKALKDKKSFINIGQSPYSMGKESIYTLKKIVEKEEYKHTIYTPITKCDQTNYDTCTLLK